MAKRKQHCAILKNADPLPENVQQRIRNVDPTPPLFCASAVRNLLVGIAPFNGIEETGFTTPTALGRLLDKLTQDADVVGECQQLDASP